MVTTLLDREVSNIGDEVNDATREERAYEQQVRNKIENGVFSILEDPVSPMDVRTQLEDIATIFYHLDYLRGIHGYKIRYGERTYNLPNPTNVGDTFRLLADSSNLRLIEKESLIEDTAVSRELISSILHISMVGLNIVSANNQYGATFLSLLYADSEEGKLPSYVKEIIEEISYEDAMLSKYVGSLALES